MKVVLSEVKAELTTAGSSTTGVIAQSGSLVDAVFSTGLSGVTNAFATPVYPKVGVDSWMIRIIMIS
jgi:hypothetical protein